VLEELAACSFKVYAVQEDFGLLVLFWFMVVIKKRINVTTVKKRFSVITSRNSHISRLRSANTQMAVLFRSWL
jgi:hypothetical protein